MQRLMVVAVLLVLGACSPSFETLRADLPKYKGRPAKDMIALWGYPNAERVIMGQKVYVWATPPSAANAVDATLPWCVMRAIVDGQGLIERFEWDGDFGACKRYSAPLKSS
jgi:hypothetical protein